MRFTPAMLVLALLAVMLPAVASAADDEIAWAASWKDAVAEAKERGAKILVVLVMDSEPANEQQQDVYRLDKGVAKAAASFVCLFACRSGDHGESRVRVGGKDVMRCRVCKTIPCSVHQTVEGFVVGRFGDVFIDDEGNVRTPVQFLVDVEGKVLETFAAGDRQSGFDVVTGPDLAGRLDAAAKKHGAGLDRTRIERFKKDLIEGEELLAKEKFAAAAEKFHDVVAGAPEGMEIVAQAKAKLAEIGLMGRGGIEEGRALAAEKKYAEALARLERVKTEFAHTPAADEAAQAIATIQSDPEVKKLMGDRAAKEESEKLLADAQKEEKRRKWMRALERYDECAAKYGKTPAGASAKKRADEIRADEKLMREIREEAAAKDCKRWLGMARNFIGAGKPDLARPHLQRVLDEYPGTSYADEAKKLLAKL